MQQFIVIAGEGIFFSASCFLRWKAEISDFACGQKIEHNNIEHPMVNSV